MSFLRLLRNLEMKSPKLREPDFPSGLRVWIELSMFRNTRIHPHSSSEVGWVGRCVRFMFKHERIEVLDCSSIVLFK